MRGEEVGSPAGWKLASASSGAVAWPFSGPPPVTQRPVARGTLCRTLEEKVPSTAPCFAVFFSVALGSYVSGAFRKNWPMSEGLWADFLLFILLLPPPQPLPSPGELGQRVAPAAVPESRAPATHTKSPDGPWGCPGTWWGPKKAVGTWLCVHLWAT